MAIIALPDDNKNHVTINPERPGEGLLDIDEALIKNIYMEHGAILFRGFDFDLGQFSGVTDRFCTTAVMNESGGRDVIDSKKNVQTVNLGAKAFALHPEMAREPWKPDVCFFACEKAPSEGGETTICDGIEIVRRLPVDLRERLEKERLLYVNEATEGELAYWLGTDRPSDSILENPPAQCPFKFVRKEDKILRLYNAPFFHRTMFQDEPAFGSFLLFSWSMGRRDFPLFAPGELIDEAIVNQIQHTSEQITQPIRWRKNDLLMVDNTRFLHGRNTITNTEERLILTYFGYLQFAKPSSEEVPNAPWRSDTSDIYVEGLEDEETKDESPKPTVGMDRIMDDPGVYLWQFLGSQARFAHMSQAAFRESIFLDARIHRAGEGLYDLNITELHNAYQSAGRKAPESAYIFHMAHCGSTLLARALEAADGSIVYREPYGLRQLGVLAASFYDQPELPPEWHHALSVSAHQLSKRYDSNRPAIVKANVPVNFMISQVMDQGPKHKAIFLYLKLEDYLLAILKSSTHRDWVQNVTAELGTALGAITGISSDERAKLSLPESVACLWLAQITLYAQALEKYAGTRSLDAELFFGQPKETLSRAFEFYANPQDDQSLDKIVSSELFSRYSKDPRYKYDNNQRVADKDQLRSKLGAEIKSARHWIDQHLGDCPIPESLPKPLLGDSPILLA